MRIKKLILLIHLLLLPACNNFDELDTSTEKPKTQNVNKNKVHKIENGTNQKSNNNTTQFSSYPLYNNQNEVSTKINLQNSKDIVLKEGIKNLDAKIAKKNKVGKKENNKDNKVKNEKVALQGTVPPARKVKKFELNMPKPKYLADIKLSLNIPHINVYLSQAILNVLKNQHPNYKLTNLAHSIFLKLKSKILKLGIKISKSKMGYFIFYFILGKKFNIPILKSIFDEYDRYRCFNYINKHTDGYIHSYSNFKIFYNIYLSNWLTKYKLNGIPLQEIIKPETLYKANLRDNFFNFRFNFKILDKGFIINSLINKIVKWNPISDNQYFLKRTKDKKISHIDIIVIPPNNVFLKKKTCNIAYDLEKFITVNKDIPSCILKYNLDRLINMNLDEILTEAKKRSKNNLFDRDRSRLVIIFDLRDIGITHVNNISIYLYEPPTKFRQIKKDLAREDMLRKNYMNTKIYSRCKIGYLFYKKDPIKHQKFNNQYKLFIKYKRSKALYKKYLDLKYKINPNPKNYKIEDKHLLPYVLYYSLNHYLLISKEQDFEPEKVGIIDQNYLNIICISNFIIDEDTQEKVLSFRGQSISIKKNTLIEDLINSIVKIV